MIEIRNLCKSFGRNEVLKNFSLIIPDNSIYGFVGPNGAGKTTTFRIMAGLLKADSGDILLDNENINLGKIRERISYMPDFFGVYDRLKVSEYMEFFASINQVDKRDIHNCTMQLLELVGLQGKEEVYVDSLSRGMKQKLCLARCLINDPDVLILDEPASGLDPGARIEFRSILKKLHSRNCTIIISSHILSELSQICSDICIINDGQNVISGTVSDIEYRMNINLKLKIKVLKNMDKAIRIIGEDSLTENLSYNGDEIYVNYSGSAEDEATLLRKLISNDVEVISFYNERGNLEDVFVEITKEAI